MKETEVNPRVSVIMGVYNAMKRKEQLLLAIRSILNQSYDNFEFIICDDCSQDDTYQFLKKIANEDDRIVLLQNNKNMRLSFTLNRCIEIAKGEYIARMDDDDVSEKNRLKKEIEFLDKNPAIDIVGTNVEYIDDMGEWGESNVKEYPQKEDLLWGPCFVHPSIMMRKDVLKALHGYKVSDVTKRGQDYDLWMRLYSAGYRGANVLDKLLQYRWDREAYRKRKFSYRFNEVKIRYSGFRKLGLYPKGYFFVIKPLLVGLVPGVLVRWIHELILPRFRKLCDR